VNQKNNKLISSLDSLVELCNRHRSNGNKIIMTNGCFDILHTGHIYLLNEAKKLGDLLIVALNSDSSVKLNKGTTRPINIELDRAYVLSAVQNVDYIIIFDEETPEKVICTILPDILVKGSDYKDKYIAGQQCLEKIGKKITLIDLIEGKSTTNLINKLDNISS
tara:strand:+ start:173 stop:664 length:492 start_codon:yes stop_codon:yes gene_type:complete